MRVCRRCGVYGPPETGVCDGCGGDLREHAASFPPLPYRCAAVRLEHRCSGCSRWVPVDGLPPDRRIACYGCGREDKIDRAQWGQVLAAMHAAADLVGEDPEGFEPSPVAIDEVNPFAAEARISAGVRFARDEAGAREEWLPDAWRLWAAPAIPVAPDTFEPYVVDVDGEGRVRVRSERSASSRYAMEPRWRERFPELLGVIAEDNQVDRTDPDVLHERGVFTCPRCGHGLPPPRRSRTRCESCRATLHVPSRVRAAASSDPRPDTWFVLFAGPSGLRRRLEREPGFAGPPLGLGEDRPLGAMPRAGRSGVARVAHVGYVLAVPLGFLALAGLLQRAPQVLGWFGW